MSHANLEIVYTVVSNDEEQLSIWPADKHLPAGWREIGLRGAKASCLHFIAQTWTDLRPASLHMLAESAAQHLQQH